MNDHVESLRFCGLGFLFLKLRWQTNDFYDLPKSLFQELWL